MDAPEARGAEDPPRMTRLRVLLAVLLRRSRLEVPAADWEGPGEREAAPAVCRQGKSNLLSVLDNLNALLALRVQAARSPACGVALLL